MKTRQKILIIARIVFLFFMAAVVAVVIAISKLDTKTLRENIVSGLQSATNMPIEITGDVSWKLSLRPKVSLKSVKIPNAKWAKQKYLFEAESITVRLDLLSLFRNRPTIQNVDVSGAKVNLEKNAKGEYSIPSLTEGKNTYTAESGVENESVKPEYPFEDPGLGGLQIRELKANILGDKYNLTGLNIRYFSRDGKREYRGWIKIDTHLLPFIISLEKYNAERKVYPLDVAFSADGKALVANVALEETSKLPIDFIIKGEIPDITPINKLFNLNIAKMPAINVNISGGMGHNKFTLHKSSMTVRGSNIIFSGSMDLNKKNPEIVLNLSSKKINLLEMFPELYGSTVYKKDYVPNVFHDMPLFGDVLYNKKLTLNVDLGSLVVYRNLTLRNLHVKARVKDAKVRIDTNTGFAGGNIRAAIDGDIEPSGVMNLEMGALGEKITVGTLLEEIKTYDFISDLPLSMEIYVNAHGTNMSQIMSTITGIVRVHSSGEGYAHSDLVAYMYGTDFLTSLRHSIHDLFSSKKKYNQMTISCLALNLKIRNGEIKTERGFAIETNAINVRLAGDINLGKETIKMALTTIPVRGLKLSLSGNIVNTISISGNLAEPDISISGAAVASKALSATGLGLLLAPFTGGIGLVAGAGVGLLAGDLLENWLADEHPCRTALEKGAPPRRGDPEWLNLPVENLATSVLEPESNGEKK